MTNDDQPAVTTHPGPRPFQFSLKTLFACLTAICVVLAIGSRWVEELETFIWLVCPLGIPICLVSYALGRQHWPYRTVLIVVSCVFLAAMLRIYLRIAVADVHDLAYGLWEWSFVFIPFGFGGWIFGRQACGTRTLALFLMLEIVAILKFARPY